MPENTSFSDQTLTCKDCGANFVWTASEQEFYQQKGFENPPARCPQCREKKKQERRANQQQFPVVCAKCGKETTVPFQPRGDRPVYCSDCFKEMKAQEPRA